MCVSEPEVPNRLKETINRKSFQRRKSQSFDVSGGFVDELIRVRTNLLVKSNQNLKRCDVSGRASFAMTEDQLKSIASMLPDEINHHGCDYELRKFQAAVFFADISGFTDLSEKYKNFENGASKLSMVLNFYLGSMVQEILSLGGDIIKYAGDAFLATFRADSEENLQEAVHKAIDAALIIQKSCTNYRTDAGVVLNGKF
jgi:class 3 adenylate cyclase